jgi:hypothetical protein
MWHEDLTTVHDGLPPASPMQLRAYPMLALSLLWTEQLKQKRERYLPSFIGTDPALHLHSLTSSLTVKSLFLLGFVSVSVLRDSFAGYRIPG